MRSALGRQSSERTILRFLVIGFFVLTGAGLRPAAALATPLRPDKSTTQPTGLAVGFGTAGNCSVGTGALQGDNTTATVTITGGGPCTVTASQPGNSQFNPAVSVPQTFNVKRATTTTTTGDIAGPYNDPETFTANVTPTTLAGQTLTGTIQFAVDTVSVGSPVTLDGAGHASLPSTISQDFGKHAITATFTSTNTAFANSSGTASLTVGQEDTQLIYSGASSGDYHDPVTLKAQLLEDSNVATPLVGKSISFHLGTQSCSPTTDNTGTASCAITPSQDPGSISTVSASFAGNTNEASSTASTPFILQKEATAINYTAPMQAIVGSPSTLTAVLTEDGRTSVTGKSVTITLGSGQTAQSCSAITNPVGTATCTLPAIKQLAGYTSVSASFAGDADYLSASDSSQHVLLFAIPASGAFVIGDSTARTALGSSQPVTWWGPRWWKQNHLSGSNTPTGFFGFTHNLRSSPATCGTTWTSSVGNSLGPPKNIPGYMGVLVTSRISKSGNTFSGNTTSLAVVKTDPAHLGNGTMLQLFCPAGPHPLRAARRVRASAPLALLHTAASFHLPSQLFGFGPVKQMHRSAHTTKHQSSQMRHSQQRRVIHITRHLRTVRHPVPFSQTPKKDQTITFGALEDHTFGDAPFTISAESITTITGPVLPPDPSTVAPPVDMSVASTVLDTTAFLYTGSNPIQTGVAAGTITRRQVSVLRGKVITRDGHPLPGATVTVLNHPEFGQTLSRADGEYDLAVNGGGQLVLNYQLTGYMSAQRQVYAPWEDYAQVDDVALVPYDPNVTPISFSSTGATLQVAQGGAQSDTDGSRQATLLFSPGTTASIQLANGTTQTLLAGHVRATEFTVGANGPSAMPATQPATSAYTYCVDFSIDEAVAAGATSVSFSQPVISYNQNFLKINAGTPLPLGHYDPATGQWIAEDNGIVVTIISIQGGMANLDLDGSGAPASPSQYAALGISDAERQQLAVLYTAGTSLWRTLLPHFTDFDVNYDKGTIVDDGSIFGPRAQEIQQDRRKKYFDLNGQLPPGIDNVKSTFTGFGTVNLFKQHFNETRIVNGTPYTLNYSSDRTPGFATPLHIPLSGPSVIPSLQFIDLDIKVAGQHLSMTFPPQPNQSYAFYWNGLDAYGRRLQGVQQATVKVTDVYPSLYALPPNPVRAFGQAGGIKIQGAFSGTATHDVGRTGSGFLVGQVETMSVGGWDARAAGLGGWTLNIHHSYDPTSKTLYLGDGTQRSGDSLSNSSIDRIAGGGGGCAQQTDSLGDGCLATQAAIGDQTGYVAFGPDGSMYTLGTRQGSRLRKVSPNGIISTLFCCFYQAPTGLAVGPDGNVYVSDGYESSVYKIDPSGQRTLVAGGANGFGGDGGPATQALLNYPVGVKVAYDGAVYFDDTGNGRIRRVGTDGIITTFTSPGGAGCAQQTNSIGDGCPIGQADVGAGPLDVGADGSIYILDSSHDRIRRVGPDGIVTTVAGNGYYQGLPADGQLATSAALGNPGPIDLTVDRQGNIFFSVEQYGQGCFVREVTRDGIERTIAGATGNCSADGDAGYATAAHFSNGLSSIAIGPDDGLYITDRFSGEIRRVAAPLPGLGDAPSPSSGSEASPGDYLIASQDGTQLYHFNNVGRHINTLDSLTGAVVYQFGYDAAGRLLSVTDGDGNVTTIGHDASGAPTSIIGPFGQTTTLSTNAEGFLASMTDPANHTIRMGYSAGGLLTSITGPTGGTFTVSYDADGRVKQASDPAGGGITLAVSNLDGGSSTTVTTAGGRISGHQGQILPSGVRQEIGTFSDGNQNITAVATDGSATQTSPSGMQVGVTTAPDPRFGIDAPLTTRTESTPGGTRFTAADGRSVTLSDPSNALSVSAATNTLTINGAAYTETYSASTHTLDTTTPAGRHLSTTIDALRRPTQNQEGNLAPIAIAYDNRGRPSSVTQGSGPDTRTATYNYGSDGRLASAVDPLGRVVSYAYDAAGHMLTQTIPDGGVVRYAYDADGNMTSITSPGGHTYNFTYDNLDRLVSSTPPDVGTGSTDAQYSYNSDRQLIGIARPDGQNVSIGYDATTGKLNSVTVPRGTVTYSYQASTGNLSSINAPDNVGLAYSYDGSVPTGTTWTGPIAGTVNRGYNNDFRLASQSVNGGPAVAYGYNPDGLPTAAGDLAITRDAVTGYVNGTQLGGCTTSTTFSGFSELSASSASFNGTPLISDSYTRDAMGRITFKAETTTLNGNAVSHTYTYSYDPQTGRLTQVQTDGLTTEHYSYDADGNRLTAPGVTTATYNAQAELTQYGSTSYTYDSGGFLATKTDASGTTAYHYDPAGSLLGVTKPDGTVISYLIDGAGHRIGKKVGGVLTQGYLYDNEGRLVAVLDGAGALLSTLVYVGADTSPSYIVTGSVEYRIISDHVGSPRLIVNSSTGQVEESLDYDAYGRAFTPVVASGWNPAAMPLGFGGGLSDPNTGLIHMGARDYDPATGRWTAREPLGFGSGDLNLYSYTFGDPVNMVDPSGAGPVLDPVGNVSVYNDPLDPEVNHQGSPINYADRWFTRLYNGWGQSVDQHPVAWAVGTSVAVVAIAVGGGVVAGGAIAAGTEAEAAATAARVAYDAIRVQQFQAALNLLQQGSLGDEALYYAKVPQALAANIAWY